MNRGPFECNMDEMKLHSIWQFLPCERLSIASSCNMAFQDVIRMLVVPSFIPVASSITYDFKFQNRWMIPVKRNGSELT